MTYLGMPEFIRGCILMYITALLFFYIFNIIRILSFGRRYKRTILPMISGLAAFTVYQYLVMVQQKDLIPDREPPFVMFAILIILLTVNAIYLHFRISEWRKTHISSTSINEAFDRLPAGLMFYADNGIPLMINDKMHQVSMDICGHSLRDSKEFENTVKDIGDKKEGQTIVRTENEKVYSINKSRIDIDGTALSELVVSDISNEYRLTEELANRQESAKKLNSRLKALMDTVEYVTMNKEMLQLKTALHDNIGQSILIAKRYLYAPDSVDKKRMLDFWKENIRHLKNDEPEEWELPYYVITKEADRLGITLNITGELPDEPALIPVIDAAISTHIGNTLKHANGTVADINVSRENGRLVLRFTNNGRQPDKEISEKGGLLNLRKEVEEAGGRMTVTSQPEYEMKIEFNSLNKGGSKCL